MIIAAVSGGPDSMAMLDKYKNDISAVCHINYNKRPTALRDEEIVNNYCKLNHIKCFTLFCSKEVYASYKSEINFQSKARKIRYDFFVKTAKELGADTLYIAHNKDDFVETAIMQMNKKSKSLFYGIAKDGAYHDLLIKRPLINIRKQSLENYCISNHIPYGIDESNLTDLYTRNIIRKKIKKMSNDEFKKVLKEIADYNKANSSLRLRVKKAYKTWEKNSFSVSWYKKLDKEIKTFVIYEFLVSHELSNPNFNKQNDIANFVCSPKGNVKYRLGNGDLLLKTNVITIEYGKK